jgi:DNA primase
VHRVDTSALKRAHPLTEVVAGYGVELHVRGSVLMGLCPFHDDRTPSLLVDPSDQHFFCFGCRACGDALTFVQRMEGLSFRAAAEHLAGSAPRARAFSAPVPAGQPCLRRPVPPVRSFTERAVLAAAAELYGQQLYAEPAALAYCTKRGLEQSTLERCRVGYCRGDTLIPYLRGHGLPLVAARRVGLLHRDGRERFRGRLAFPEVRAGQPVWLIGRAIMAHGTAPRYLGLPGAKPLLGWEAAISSPQVTLVEGVFDLLVLRQWGEPALALAGTHASPSVLEELRRFPRIVLALDADPAGQAASAVLQRRLGGRARSLILPDVKDVSELAPQPDGYSVFLRALDAVPPLAAA